MATVQEVQNGAGAEKAEAPSAAVTFTGLKPHLLVEAPKASDAVQFYKTAFGAAEIGRSVETKRKAEQELPLISCAQLEIAGYTFLVADDSAAPAKNGGNGCVLCLETEDVEAAVAKAVSAGAVADGGIAESTGACCAERVGKVVDPYGFAWLICSPVKKCGDVEA